MSQEQYTAFSSWYDAMMGQVDYKSWAAYLLGFLREKNVSRLVECACGTGNITRELLLSGLQVTGLDCSEDMLMVAREKLRKQGLRCPLVREDMRCLSVHKPVEAVVCGCDGVNYLTEGVADFFSAAYKALLPGGLLLFDISSYYKLSRVLADKAFGDKGKDWGYVWENHFDRDSSLLEMELTCFVKEDGKDGYRRFEERHLQRAYRQEELTEALLQAGFRDIRVYGAFSLTPPEKNSERLQFIAYK